MTLGQRIKQRRKNLGYSVDDVAQLLNKNRATVYRYENDAIGNMPASVLEPLAAVLNTTPAYLMGWDDGYSRIGSEIKRRRLELGLTLEEVGDRVGVSKSTVQKWETGDIVDMERDKITLLSMALQISPSELIDWGSPHHLEHLCELDDFGSIPGRLKILRERADIDYETAAKGLGATPDYVEKNEMTSENLSIEYLCRVCYYYGVSADWILGIQKGLYKSSASATNSGLIPTDKWGTPLLDAYAGAPELTQMNVCKLLDCSHVKPRQANYGDECNSPDNNSFDT